MAGKWFPKKDQAKLLQMKKNEFGIVFVINSLQK